jgi:hypothetical protein
LGRSQLRNFTTGVNPFGALGPHYLLIVGTLTYSHAAVLAYLYRA